MLIGRIVSFLFAMMFVFSADTKALHASELNKDALAGKPPTIAIYNYFPYGERNIAGEPSGIFYDFIQLISQHSGVPFESKVLPLARSLRAAAMGDVDFLISYEDPVMAKDVEFINHFACAAEVLATKPSLKLQKVSDINGLKVAFPRLGYFETNVLESLQITEFALSRPEHMIDLLEANRVDGISLSNWVLDAYLAKRKQGLKPLASLNTVNRYIVRNFKISLSISKVSNYQELKRSLRQSITILRENQDFLRIVNTYTGSRAGECRHSEASG